MALTQLLSFFSGLGQFLLAYLVYFFQQPGLPVLLDQGDCRLEGDEVPQFGHVNAVAVRIPDLRSGGGGGSFPRIGAAQDAEDGPSQRGAADDGVVNEQARLPVPRPRR